MPPKKGKSKPKAKKGPKKKTGPKKKKPFVQKFDRTLASPVLQPQGPKGRLPPAKNHKGELGIRKIRKGKNAGKKVLVQSRLVKSDGKRNWRWVQVSQPGVAHLSQEKFRSLMAFTAKNASERDKRQKRKNTINPHFLTARQRNKISGLKTRQDKVDFVQDNDILGVDAPRFGRFGIRKGKKKAMKKKKKKRATTTKKRRRKKKAGPGLAPASVPPPPPLSPQSPPFV